jgi:cob(I)alamin adenosyltransferase
VSINSQKTISEVVDALERIQQDLFGIQRVLEKMEKAETAIRVKRREVSIPPQPR